MQTEVVWVQQVMLIHEIRLANENIFKRNVFHGKPPFIIIRTSETLQENESHRSMNNASVSDVRACMNHHSYRRNAELTADLFSFLDVGRIHRGLHKFEK